MNGDRQRRRGIGGEVALYSILGFWLFYILIVSARAAVLGFPAPAELAQRRGVVTAAGIAITYLLYLLLRSADRRPLGTRIAVAFIGAVPCALAIAAFNYWIFNVYDAASLFDAADAGFDPPTAVQEIAEFAISRYFFLTAWAALYLAISYAAEMREADRRAAAYARAAQEAEIRALRYQVNPHFLFNTLNSLSALVMTERAAEAEAMIMNLATFYRTSLSSDPLEDALLGDEVGMQRLYLDIERVRFRDRLAVAIDVPSRLERACVPALILQPLVENAIKYGVSPVTRRVTIRITAHTERGRLTITVADDGAGPGATEARGEGIGLANVRDRLAARFGGNAGLAIDGAPATGFSVTITIPEVYHDC